MNPCTGKTGLPDFEFCGRVDRQDKSRPKQAVLSADFRRYSGILLRKTPTNAVGTSQNRTSQFSAKKTPVLEKCENGCKISGGKTAPVSRRLPAGKQTSPGTNARKNTPKCKIKSIMIGFSGFQFIKRRKPP